MPSYVAMIIRTVNRCAMSNMFAPYRLLLFLMKWNTGVTVPQ